MVARIVGVNLTNQAPLPMSRSIYKQPKYSAAHEWRGRDACVPSATAAAWTQWQQGGAAPPLGIFGPPTSGFVQQFMKPARQTQILAPPPRVSHALSVPCPSTQIGAHTSSFIQPITTSHKSHNGDSGTTTACVPRAQRQVSSVSSAPAPPNGARFTPLSMVHKQTLRAGQGYACASGDMLDVSYVGWLARADPHSSRFDEAAHFQFVLGAGEVIAGWDSAIVGMLEGEKARLLIPAALAYGERGMPPKIPPNSDLQFEIQINGVVCAPPSVMHAVVRANASIRQSASPTPAAAPHEPTPHHSVAPAPAVAPTTPFTAAQLRELIPSPPKRDSAQDSAQCGAPIVVKSSVPSGRREASHVAANQSSPRSRSAARAAANAAAVTTSRGLSADPAAASPRQPIWPCAAGVDDADGTRRGTASMGKSVRFDASVELPSPRATDPRKYHDRAVAEIMRRKMCEQTSALQQAFPFGVPGQGDFMRRGFKHL